MSDKGANIVPAPPLPKLPSKEELHARRVAEGFAFPKHEEEGAHAAEEAAAPPAPEPVAAAPAPVPAAAAQEAPKPAAAPAAPKPAAPAAAPKPAAPPAAKPAPAAAAPAAKPAAAAAISSKPAAPAARPAAAAPAGVSRRGFVTWFAIGWTAFGLAMGGALTILLRFLFPNVLFEPPSSFKAGFPDTFGVGQVNEDFKDKFGVWIVRNEEGVYALSTTCTHLGCIPNWLATEEKFKCPCHGSGFYKTGINFEGPAPRPLERYRVALADDGQVLVDKTRKFQQELGQWADPDAFLKLA